MAALADADPQNAQWQIDLIHNHINLIGIARAAGDTAASRLHLTAARTALDRLDREGKGQGDAKVAEVRAYLAGLGK